MDLGPLAEFLAQLGAASIQASLLALAVWAVCRLLGRHLSAQWRCALWWLAILRLAWPFSFTSPVSLFNLPRVLFGGFQPDDMQFYFVGELARTAVRSLQSPGVVLVWAGVTALVVVRALAGWCAAKGLVATARPLGPGLEQDVLTECAAALLLREKVELRESDEIESPCVTGVFHPVLLLPVGLAEVLSRQQLQLVILHELAHLQRRDLSLNWLLTAVEAVHWFNPLVWLGMREIRASREEACDARALEAHPEAVRMYGETLLQLVQRRVMPRQMAPLGGDGMNPMVRRLHAVVAFRPGIRNWIVGFGAFFVLVCAGFTDAERPGVGGAPEAAPTLLTDLAAN
jgi:bla regulator protein blaR1